MSGRRALITIGPSAMFSTSTPSIDKRSGASSRSLGCPKAGEGARSNTSKKPRAALPRQPLPDAHRDNDVDSGDYRSGLLKGEFVMATNATTAEDRLVKLGLYLPDAPTPFGAYVPAIQTSNLLFLSGMLATSGHSAT